EDGCKSIKLRLEIVVTMGQHYDSSYFSMNHQLGREDWKLDLITCLVSKIKRTNESSHDFMTRQGNSLGEVQHLKLKS
ncbi:hypothetical protein HAX54_029072, partial [Datura stramonium]|nr:hypothetical protein [Datura stramonium]